MLATTSDPWLERSRVVLCSLSVPASQEEPARAAACEEHARLVKAVWPKPSHEASEAYMSKRQVRLRRICIAKSLPWRVVRAHRQPDP